jgi:bacterioferritin-associated ferredoxin
VKRGVNCKGELEQNTGCGFCGKCLATAARLKREHHLEVTETQIRRFEMSTTDRTALEVLRLARIGLWAEISSVLIDDALQFAVRELPIQRSTKFQHVINTRPGK